MGGRVPGAYLSFKNRYIMGASNDIGASGCDYDAYLKHGWPRKGVRDVCDIFIKI